MDVNGKKALVFGGTSGIGLATTLRLAAAGAQVVAISRDPSKAPELPDGVTTAACDVLDRDRSQALFAAEAPFDILVSAATGGERAVGPFLSMDMDGFQGSFDKLWGYANVVRFGTEHMAEDGAIVLVSGAPARTDKPAGMIAIGSTGAAVEAMARWIATEIAPRRLNVVAPGIIDTPMNPLQGEERRKAYEASTAGYLIPRAGTADECAQAAMFLIENDFVTGTTVDVDGGWLLA